MSVSLSTSSRITIWMMPASGIASSAPTMPSVCEPARTAMKMISGWQRNGAPENRWLDDRVLDLLVDDDEDQHDDAIDDATSCECHNQRGYSTDRRADKRHDIEQGHP